MHYFEQLQKDWDALGFGFNTPYRPTYRVSPEDVSSHNDIHNLMINLSLNVASIYSPWNRNRIKTTDEQLHTELGKRLLFLCQLPKYSESVDRWMCSDSEPRITEAFDPDNIQSSNFSAPIIVTRDNLAIGAIKRFGERSYYALRDDSQSNTYANFVYRTPLGSWEKPFLHPHKSPRAGSIDMDNVTDHIGMARLTFFAVPVEARKDIKVPHHRQECKKPLTISHEHIVQSIDHALLDAEPTELGYQYSTKDTTC